MLAAVGTGASVPGKAWSSASPTFLVVPLTVVTVSRRLVVARSGKLTLVPMPALSRAGTGTVVPSEKVRVPPVIWSLALGRSKSTTRFRVTAAGKARLR